MEFLIYLSTIGKDIYTLISQKVRVVENSPICRQHEIYGWYDSATNSLSICTDRIKSGPDVKYYINETLFHEAVHVAQDCKAQGRDWYVPFGINPSQMKLSPRRIADLNTATRRYPNMRAIEHEAFWMEDKPGKVKYVLKKYCF